MDRAWRSLSAFPRFFVLAPHLESWEWCLWWMGLLDVSNHDPGRGGYRDTGVHSGQRATPRVSLLASKHGETQQSSLKDEITVLRERQRLPGTLQAQPPAEPEPGRGRALPALPAERPT